MAKLAFASHSHSQLLVHLPCSTTGQAASNNANEGDAETSKKTAPSIGTGKGIVDFLTKVMRPDQSRNYHHGQSHHDGLVDSEQSFQEGNTVDNCATAQQAKILEHHVELMPPHIDQFMFSCFEKVLAIEKHLT
jgi:hypothetical protein